VNDDDDDTPSIHCVVHLIDADARAEAAEAKVTEQAAEIERLRERLGPRGLEVVMIDGTGHYVSAAVAAKLREAVEIIKALCRAHETLRVHYGDLPNTSHAVNDGLDFLATMEKPCD
jgi:hypothetical protein